MGSPKSIETTGRKYLETSSWVLCREIVFILECPLCEIPLYCTMALFSSVFLRAYVSKCYIFSYEKCQVVYMLCVYVMEWFKWSYDGIP